MKMELTENWREKYPLDGYLKTALNEIIKAVRNNWDCCIIVDGVEGSGKSVLAIQSAYYCDPTIDLDRVVFTPEAFMKTVINAKPYQAIVYDEAMSGMYTREAMGKMNKMLIKMMAEIRQKNLIFFIVLPSFFELSKYISIHRSRALIHVYTKGFERGKFAYFNTIKKRGLYVYGKKFYNYQRPKANFIGSFRKYFPLDEEKYKELKYNTLKRYLDEGEKKESREHDRNIVEVRNSIIENMRKLKYKWEDIHKALDGTIVGVSFTTLRPEFYRWRKAKREEAGDMNNNSKLSDGVMEIIV